MSNNDINKAFISIYDKFLYNYDKEHEKSPSQLKEIQKHKRIAGLRDSAETAMKADEIWEDF